MVFGIGTVWETNRHKAYGRWSSTQQRLPVAAKRCRWCASIRSSRRTGTCISQCDSDPNECSKRSGITTQKPTYERSIAFCLTYKVLPPKPRILPQTMPSNIKEVRRNLLSVNLSNLMVWLTCRFNTLNSTAAEGTSNMVGSSSVGHLPRLLFGAIVEATLPPLLPPTKHNKTDVSPSVRENRSQGCDVISWSRPLRSFGSPSFPMADR